MTNPPNHTNPPAAQSGQPASPTKALPELASHHLHPFTNHKQLAATGTRVIERGQGLYVYDDTGKELFDAMSGLWCVNIGYGRSELSQAAKEQMDKLAYYNTFFHTTTAPAEQLARRLTSLATPAGNNPFTRVFFTNSGSEANDTNLRLVWRYWDALGQPQRKLVISRHNAYHGSTLGGSSLGGMAPMHKHGGLAVNTVVHIDQPYYLQHARPDESHDAFGRRAAGWLEEKIVALGPDKVGAFIAEPIQGAGGVIVPPSSYWPEIQRIVDKYNILLICDEVVCGFGRTGSWFAFQHLGVRPDLVTFAKGVTSGYLPLGGVLISDKVAGPIIASDAEFAHGFTYSGHPVCCAVALANLEIIERERLVERVREQTGPHLARSYARLAEHPLVGSAETCGLMGALLLVKNKATMTLFDQQLAVGMRVRAQCFAHGLIMRAVGDRMIIAPPLCATTEDIDELLQRITRVLNATLAELQAESLL